MMVTLYRKNSFGIGRWCIISDGNAIRFGHSATLDGSLVMNEEIIDEGKAGRSIKEQIDLRMNSRISKMRDKGYKDTTDEAAAAMTNQLGLITPMLAKPLKANKIVKSIIQPKYNGHRCLITCADGEIIAYSRQGKIIHTMEHITKHFKDVLPEGAVVDGELFIPGAKLQSIASLVKRKQEKSKDVTYYAYDYIDDSDHRVGFSDRLKILIDLLRNVGASDSILLAESIIVNDLDQAMEIYSAHLAQGHEGSILRVWNGKYESGKRSSGLLKMKPIFDTEAEVIDIVPGETGLGICVCRMDGLDQTFKVLAPGPHRDKIEALYNKEKFIGMRVKIEYRELTADKIPFHAVATEWFSSI